MACQLPNRARLLGLGAIVTILLVEDSPDNQVLIQSYLKSTSHRIDLADNGQIGVAKFQNGHYDLILMDMQMPVMDGLTATRTIRRWEQEQGLPASQIVALTALALKEESARIFEAGCNTPMTKPLQKTTLLELLAAYEKTRSDARQSRTQPGHHSRPHQSGPEPIVPGFPTNRRRDLVTIEACLQQSDFNTIRMLGHRMR